MVKDLIKKERIRFLKFCTVGASGVPVNLLCTWLGYNFIFFPLRDEPRSIFSYLMGITISIFTNFLINNFWTWADKKKPTQTFQGRLLKFYLVSSFGAGIQFGVAVGLNTGFQFHYLISQLVGIGLATMLNFLLNHNWTYGT